MEVTTLPMDRLGKKEGKLLEQNLSDGEKVLSVCVGSSGQAVILTDKKVLFVKVGYMAGQAFGGKAITYSYDNITSVEVKTGIMTGVFEIASGGVQGYERSNWGKGSDDAYKAPNTIPFVRRDAKKFQLISTYIREHKHNLQKEQGSQQPSTMDIPGQIRKLADLHNQGILTKEEFESKKADLLSRM